MANSFMKIPGINFKHIRTSITLVTSLLIFLIFVSFGFITYNLNQVLIKGTISTIHKEITNKVLVKLDVYLDTPYTVNNLTDAFLRINPEHLKDLDLLRKYLYKQLSIFKTVNLIAFGTENGDYVEAQRLEDGRIRTGVTNNSYLELWKTDTTGQKIILEKMIQSYDPRLRPWYINSKNKRIPAWSDIYLYSSNNKPAISANQPYFFNSNTLDGVITTSITLDGISKFLSELTLDNNSSVLILEPSNLAIATSEEIPLLDKLNKRITGSNLENRLFSSISKFFQLSIENNYTNIISDFSMVIDNTKYLIRSTPFYGPYGLRWNILVIIPEADYMSVFYRASTFGMLIFLIFMSITFISSFFIAGQIAKPIVQLSTLVSRITLEKDNISKLTIPKKILTRNDEIGTLAESFSNMNTELGSVFLYLKKSQKDYKELVENINSIIMRVTSDGTIIYCNPFGLKFYGYKKDELIGSTVQDTVLKTNDPGNFDILEKIFKKDQKYWNGINKNITTDGKEVWILWANTLIYNQNGTIKELLSIGQDFTSKKDAESKLNASLEEKNILLKEVHHRVKNNLQIITSLINLQLADISNGIIQETLESLQSRIQSMSLVHEMLYSTDSLTQIDFHEYLNQIIATISATFNNIKNPVQVTLTGDVLYLDIERSTTCGLIINEIIINAFKHAFVGQDNCKIDITLNKDNSELISIIVRDNGIGVSSLSKTDNTQGMGSLLIDALTDQIGGKILISKTKGTSVNLTFKN